MAESEQEPSDADGVVQVDGGGPRTKGRRSFSRMRRELTDEELTQPAVQKLMMDELDRLEEEGVQSKAYITKFHDADKQVSVLSEKLKNSRSSDVAFGTLLTFGAAAIGYSPALATATAHHDQFLLIFGCLLIVAGLVVKVIQR